MGTPSLSRRKLTDIEGLGVLFGKLQQGVQENQQVLTIARMRVEAEELYGQHLAGIGAATDKIPNGFQRDEGASVRKAYDGIRTEMDEASKNHKKIANNIRELVVTPFCRWCDDHATRVQNSQDDLQARIKLHDKQAEVVRKYRSQYYNKCRLVEDLEEEDKLAFQDPQSEAAQSPKVKPIPTIKEPDPNDDDDDPIELGERVLYPDQVKKILTHMLENIRLRETKVPILGTYQNTSTGADITDYMQKFMDAGNIAAAERVGQDLIDNGFLRLIGNVGSQFANSTRMNYQWRTKVFKITGIPEKKPKLNERVQSGGPDSIDSPVAGSLQEYLAGWNPINSQHPNETPGERLRREARESDERYKASVRKLDALRCNLEEAMIDHLKFMERCELDRLKAIKSVILDFSGAISNVIPSLQSTVDNMMLFQETVQPLGDLRYLLENYRTGPFVPKVAVYENYYNSVDGENGWSLRLCPTNADILADQTFGVDLEARARADRKRVPLIVTTLLTYLDNHYPDLDGDEARRAIWLVDVPLAAAHHLRTQINNGKPIPHDLLEKYEIPIVASVLKLYLLELPDSLVSSHVYEIVKTIYSSANTADNETTRISVIQSTLGQLRLANIATLDAITTHFTRLIELTSADDTYVSSLATNLAACILRPKQETTLTMNEKYSYRLLRDLLTHHDPIFGELKRASSQAHRQSLDTANTKDRGRQLNATITTDESGRRLAEEERRQAIMDRSRATSPAPGDRRSMRRERSPHRLSGGPETRFPVAVKSPIQSPTAGTTGSPTAGVRARTQSLEVPGSNDNSPIGAAVSADSPILAKQNGTLSSTAASTSYGGAPAQSGAESGDGVAKRDSLGRSGARVARKPEYGVGVRQSLYGGKKGSQGSLKEMLSQQGGQGEHRGVELVDRPMDD